MNAVALSTPSERTGAGRVALAFGLLYLSWGTTYFAIRQGVHTHHLPPFLFNGLRVALAGLILLGYLGCRGKSVALSRVPLGGAVLSGALLFVGGNGLMAMALESMPSGLTAVFTAATPLWMALLEMLCPRGDRLRWRGCLGLALGMTGVIVLVMPRVASIEMGAMGLAPILVLISTVSWAAGSLVVRYQPRPGPHLTSAAYQMAVGGALAALLGVALGEFKQVNRDLLVPGAVGAFVYLLVVGSLVGFLAFHWLLQHVRATLVGTYAYVNPLVAVLLGWLLGGEEVGAPLFAAMTAILVGVALVRASGRRLPAANDSVAVASEKA